MEFNILFLLTSIVTARYLEKKKMHAASAMYSVMFIILLTVLLFTIEVEPISSAMLRLCGREVYYGVQNAFLDATNSSAYGVYIVGSILLTVAVQVTVTVLTPVRAIVRYFVHKKKILQKFRKAYVQLVHQARSVNIVPPINRLYCRMLN